MVARREHIISGRGEPLPEPSSQVVLRMFASAQCGATGMSTGTATFTPAARLPYHTHHFSEAVTILKGKAAVAVEGRRYCLRPFDCIHIPAGAAHEAVNASSEEPLLAFSAFASSTPSRKLVADHFVVEDRSSADPRPGDPEHLVRFAKAPGYELSPETEFYDLFAGRFGAIGICGGYGRFERGSSLPCHVHDYDESITIIEGTATCEVAGRRYRLTGCDTAFVPQGRPHRFLNESRSTMAMIWVYAGSEPERTILDVGYCTGALRYGIHTA